MTMTYVSGRRLRQACKWSTRLLPSHRLETVICTPEFRTCGHEADVLLQYCDWPEGGATVLLRNAPLTLCPETQNKPYETLETPHT